MPHRVQILFLLMLGISTWAGCGKNLAPSNPGSGSSVPSYAFQFNYGDEGFAGTGNGQFEIPYGVAVYNNWLFVVDFGSGGASRVQKFDLNGNFLVSTVGNPAKHLNGAEGIAIDRNGILYVTDQGNAVIQKLDANGNYLGSLGGGTADAVLGDYNQPFGIAVDSQSNVYVADHGNERLEKCSSTGTSFVTVGSFSYVAGVAVDGSDNVWVTDQSANKVYEYSSSLSLLNTYGTAGSAPGDLDGPRGIAIAPDGSVAVADYLNSRVERFSSNWNYLGMIGTKGPGTNPGQLTIPNFITFDSHDAYVSDYQNEVVMKF